MKLKVAAMTASMLLISSVDAMEYQASRPGCGAWSSDGSLGYTTEDELIMEFFEKATVDDVRACLDTGADPEAVSPGTGEYILHIAAGYGSPEVVKLLIEAGANVNVSNFLISFISSRTGWPIGICADYWIISGYTPLHTAARHGRLEALEVLLEAGADSKAVDSNYQTAWDYMQEYSPYLEETEVGKRLRVGHESIQDSIYEDKKAHWGCIGRRP